MSCSTAQIQVWIDLANAGDAAAREKLIVVACERLRRLAHNMLAGDRLRRWEETDDVLQQALVRLHRDLEKLRPATVRDFLRLAAFQIRRVLVELARHYYGPRGLGANHASSPAGDTDSRGAVWDTPDSTASPSLLVCQEERWQKLYEAIDNLQKEEREVVELLHVHDLTQDQAAQVIGVDVRTVQRRWQKARLRLAEQTGIA